MPTDALGWTVVLMVTVIVLVFVLLIVILGKFTSYESEPDNMAAAYVNDKPVDGDSRLAAVMVILMLIGIVFMASNFSQLNQQLVDEVDRNNKELLRTRAALTTVNLELTAATFRIQELQQRLNVPPPYCSPVAPSEPVPLPSFGRDSQFHISGRMEGHGTLRR